MGNYTGRRKSWVVAFLGAMVAIHAVLLWNARDLIKPGYPDFTTFYDAGANLRNGTAAQLYPGPQPQDGQTDFAAGEGIGGIDSSPATLLPYMHPPYECLIFAPLSLLPYGAAYLTWNAINLLLLLACGLLLGRELFPDEKHFTFFWLLAGLGFFPTCIVLLQGQDSIALLLLFAMVYLSLNRGQEFLAGAWLGAGLLRPQIVLPFLLILLFRRQRARFLGGFFTSAMVLGIISIWTTNWRTVLYYPLFLLQMNRRLGGRTIFPADMPNLRGLASQWLLLGTPAWLATASVALFSVLLIVLAGRLWRRTTTEPSRRKNDRETVDELAFAVSTVVALLVSYYIHLHDLSLLLLPAVLLAKAWLREGPLARPWGTVAALAVAALFFSPLYVALMRYRGVSLLAYLLLLIVVALAMVSSSGKIHLASTTTSMGR